MTLSPLYILTTPALAATDLSAFINEVADEAISSLKAAGP